jgi:hypothetical protein
MGDTYRLSVPAIYSEPPIANTTHTSSYMYVHKF